LILTKRNRTSAKVIGYGLYLYFLGLSYRNTAKALSFRFKKEVILLYGNGYRNTNQKKYFVKEEKSLDL
jgi:hypothetical protein